MPSWVGRTGALAILVCAPLGCDGGDSDGEGGSASTSAGPSGSVQGPSGSGSGAGQTGQSAQSGQAQSGQSGQSGTGGNVGCETSSDCPDDGLPCRQPYCDAGTCTETFDPQGTPVGNDEPEDCRAAVCDGVGDVETVADDTDTPDDGRECTADVCEAGLPTSTPKPPGALCSENEGRFCSAAGTCQFCPPIDEVCSDAGPGEPNDAQGAAHPFGEIGDDDDLGQHVCGVLGPDDAADWYTYTGRDAFFAEVGPGRVVAPQDDHPAGSLRICKYVACVEGPTVFTCPADTTPDVAAGGQQGCCAPSLVDISDDFLDDLCSETGDDDAQVWIKIERVGDAPCVPYDLDFHY